MGIPLRVLHIEDNEDDSLLIADELRRGGYDPTFLRVETPEDMRAALQREQWDLVIADYALPRFSGPAALEVMRETPLDVPVIIVSGTVGEEAAVVAMKTGARDYYVKGKLGRFPAAVERELREAEIRQEHRRTQEFLQQSEARFRTVVENISDIITIVDRDGVICYQSHGAKRVLGLEPEELIGKPFAGIIHPEDLLAVQRAFARFLEDPAAVAPPLDLRARHADGSWRTIQCQGVNLLDRPGVAGIVVVSRDVTEQRRLEAQLLQAQKMETVGRLAGGVAHDFNNLLTAISGYAGLVQESLLAEDARREDIEQVLRAAERAKTLTQRLLAFSRRQVISLQVISLNDLIVDLHGMLRRLISEDIELTTHPAPDLGLVKADLGQIEQVLVNLVVNARDAMPHGGRLIIETANVTLDEEYTRTWLGTIPGDYVLLSVSDTGTGMTDEVKARLFEPFFTTKEVDKGTGLGLATVYGIVKQHGGQISAYSELGHGSTFRVYLPRVVGEKAAEGRRHDESSPPPRGSETILVVEDDPLVRAIEVRALRDLGYTVLEASDGHEGLQVLWEHRTEIRLLMTDLVMPKMGGKELAERVKAMCPDVKVLFLSGHAERALAPDGLLGAGVSFLAKPFNGTVLARTVRRLLDSRG